MLRDGKLEVGACAANWPRKHYSRRPPLRVAMLYCGCGLESRGHKVYTVGVSMLKAERHILLILDDQSPSAVLRRVLLHCRHVLEA